MAACDADVKGLHVAWTADLGYAALDPEVRTLCENAAADFEERLGCHVEVVNPESYVRSRQYWETYHHMMGRDGITP